MRGMPQCWYMVIRIELHIKGWMVHSEKQEISGFDDNLSTQMNVTIREFQVRLWVQKIKVEHSKRIEKADDRSAIYVYIESSGNNLCFDDEIILDG